MAYLDVSPMISALRTSPDMFEFTKGSLHHIPSRHRFRFDKGGTVRVDAQCSCSTLRVSYDQEKSLVEAFNEWNAGYWRPAQINKEFAGHFAPLSGWRRVLFDFAGWLQRAVLSGAHKKHEDHVAVPAE